jgi:hypothetical protein
LRSHGKTGGEEAFIFSRPLRPIHPFQGEFEEEWLVRRGLRADKLIHAVSWSLLMIIQALAIRCHGQICAIGFRIFRASVTGITVTRTCVGRTAKHGLEEAPSLLGGLAIVLRI